MGIEELIDRGGSGYPPIRATVAETPASVDALLKVTIPSFSEDHAIAVPWMPRVHSVSQPDGEVAQVVMPVAGDPCLVVFDDQQVPWVVAWWRAGLGNTGD